MESMLCLNMDDDRVRYLCNSDKTLKELINQIGTLFWPVNTDYFTVLVRSIVGQQLSNKAAESIYGRLEMNWGPICPDVIADLPLTNLASIGLSKAKTQYIQGLAKSILSGEIDFNWIQNLSDGDATRFLMKTKGIGKWTAEMFLIFSLGRMNILSFGDAGIQSTIRWLYKIPEDELKTKMSELYNIWNPYNTIASLYLWEAVDRGFMKFSQQAFSL